MALAQADECDPFRSPLLEAVRRAFMRRGKAIRYHAKAFSTRNERDEGWGDPPERLDVTFRSLDAQPVSIQLSLWPDGGLWFLASKHTQSGVAFEQGFHGRLTEPRSRELVAWFEESIALAGPEEEEGERRRRRLALWHPVNPQPARDR